MQCARANRSAICGYSLKTIRTLPETAVLSVFLCLFFLVFFSFFADARMVVQRIKKEQKQCLVDIIGELELQPPHASCIVFVIKSAHVNTDLIAKNRYYHTSNNTGQSCDMGNHVKKYANFP